MSHTLTITKTSKYTLNGIKGTVIKILISPNVISNYVKCRINTKMMRKYVEDVKLYACNFSGTCIRKERLREQLNTAQTVLNNVTLSWNVCWSIRPMVIDSLS